MQGDRSTLLALSQPRIMAAPLAQGSSLAFRLLPEADPRPALRALREEFPIDWGVIGIGEQVVRALGASIAGLRTFPAMSGAAASVPSTQQALWVFLCGNDRTTLFDREGRVTKLLASAFALDNALETFTYRDGRDLSGYLDGTANPAGDDAIDAALAEGPLAGSSFVAVQRWLHDLERFASFTPKRRDDSVGRYISNNEEIEDAPESSHVKRTAQETYDPPAFVVRRSMPWADGTQAGLEFILYGNTLDKFERMMIKMAGLTDGISDALFSFSRPVQGAYYWCPPIRDGKLDLRQLKI